DGVAVIDDFGPRGLASTSGALNLNAGQSYTLTLEYQDSVGLAEVKLDWQSPSKVRATVKPTTSGSTGLAGLTPFAAFMGGALPSTTPGAATGAATANASTSLGVGMLLSMSRVPNSNLLYIGSRDGRIETIDPAAAPNSGTMFMDISAQVWTGQDSGLLGMAFHPEYEQAGSPNRGYFYLYYVTQIGGDEFIRLSRFNRPDGQTVADVSSEVVLIQQRLGPTLHRGGGLLFGLDGFLYLSIGDLGWRNRTQTIDDIFVGGVLRIDVDQDASRSHPIVTALQPGDADSFNQGYYIPDSNPWVGQPGALEEFYAIGTRNPHRMSIDATTGRILIGDVGSYTSDGLPTSHEEINEVVAGANFGWPFREAYADFAPRPSPLLGVLQDHNFAYPRSTGACIIGGHVYRGTALPHLQGRYILGDCTNNRVWAMADDAGHGPMELLFNSPAAPVTTFGIDQDGEVYLGGGGSTVYRLVSSGAAVADPPALLSQTGAFADLATLTPAAGFIPYGMNNPLWSDAAHKLRWMAVPNDGTANTAAEQIVGGATGDWAFPVGTVFIKHFELPLSTGGIRRLETRFLVHGTDGRYWGVTYRWRPDGSDAELLTTELDETIDGQTWHYPSRSECLQCHNTSANQVLGPRTAQMNRPLYYPGSGVTANQLTTLSSLGLLSSSLGDPLSLPAARSVHSLGATLETRVKSYLSSNCAHCHRPGGQGRGTFDTQFDTPMVSSDIVNGTLADDLGVANARVIAPQDLGRSIMYQRINAVGGAQMPPLARNVVDPDAVQLFAEWVESVNDSPGPTAPVASGQAVVVAQGGSVVIDLTGSDADGDQLDFVLMSNPTHGHVRGVGDQLVYTPNAHFVGADSFSFSANDGGQLSPSATINITVNP
ncbi:MAG: PQQ-dependent sugar dehydrogenase, partial [Myxococcota bacterium]